MKKIIDGEKLDIAITPSDWRYSAAIVGINRYLKKMASEEEFEILDNEIRFSSELLTNGKYLEFIEKYYDDELHHRKVESILRRDEWSDEQIKYINELLKGNSIMKKTFGKLKFDGSNAEEILKTIENNRDQLILETFRNKRDMYANFANTNQLGTDSKECCRLLGYYVDKGRKSKSIAYNFDANTFKAEDDRIFDFIPFAFSRGREAFLVNANYSVKRLIQKSDYLNDCIEAERSKKAEEGKEANARQILFRTIKEVADFIDYDVEVITKNQMNNYFETIFIRKESIEILRHLKFYDVFCFPFKRRDGQYIDIQKEVMECILNMRRADGLIELFLKENVASKEFLISQLIEINLLICKEEGMKQLNKVAYACAKEVVKRLPDNKRNSYRQKLTNAIIFKDYDRVNDILTQLSIYADVPFDFAFGLFEDFEMNKDVAYTFINALTSRKKTDEENGGN